MRGRMVKYEGWTPGEKVEASRVVDALGARGPIAARSKAAKDGSLTLTLEPGRYILRGEGEPPRQVRVTVAADEKPAVDAATAKDKLTPDEIRERLARTRPADARGEVVIGTRSSADAKRELAPPRVIPGDQPPLPRPDLDAGMTDPSRALRKARTTARRPHRPAPRHAGAGKTPPARRTAARAARAPARRAAKARARK